MASVTTSDFVATASRLEAPPFSLIEQKSLLARLLEELRRTSQEFARDPRAFLRNLFTDDTRDAKRRRRIYFGLAGALVVHAALLAVIVVLGWRHLSASEEGQKVILLPGLAPPVSKVNETTPDVPQGDNARGGAGGRPDSAPATKGAPPPTSPAPIVKPFTPSVSRPVLPVTESIKGPESTPLAANLPVGIPNGAMDAPPAPGAGTGNGIGGRNGDGAGRNDGPGGGSRQGVGNNPDGRTPGTPDGKGSITEIFFPQTKPAGYMPFTWTRRATPMITPEAQEHRAAGRVLLRATFNADGTITDIEVVNQVEYMTESAIDSLRRSKFRPATINGVPVTVRRVPVYVDVHY